ncbi:MAG: hypothetical protein SOY54_04015 [Bacilli bacterium]|nr:hypothetical protein [Bacilli bacterium]
MSRNYDFPYPILKNDFTSSYNPNCSFEIVDIDDAQFLNNNFIIKLQITLQSKTLEKYLNNNDCNIYISYTTDTSRRMIKIDNKDIDYSLQIPINILKSVDTINIYAYVISEKEFKMEFTDEMDQDYDVGQPLFITKKDILAISNNLEFLYNRTGETIIQFTEIKDENFKDFKIDLSGENYINIQISHTINEGYQRIKSSKNKSNIGILNTSFVHFALVYTLSILASEGIDEHKNKRWFRILVQVFSARNIDIKNELQEMSGNLDMNKIYDYVQKFMNNCFEQSIILAGKESC